MPAILVVDDDRAMVRTLCDIFRSKGWDPTPAHSGEQALEIHKQRAHDWVLMDVKMPGIDGIATFKKMRELSPEVRAILMTAHTSPECIQDAERSGVSRVIPKPIDLPALFDALA